MKRYGPLVLQDQNSRPVLVFAKGRVKYHAVVATDQRITLDALDSLRGLKPVERKGQPYSPKRAASFWLNHDHREITARARQVLRGLVSREVVS